MINKSIELILTPEEAFNPELFKENISARLGLSAEQTFRILRRSIDARSRNAVVKVLVEVITREGGMESARSSLGYPEVSPTKRAVIIGAGPAGLFAALRFIESGIKPVILERGKDVQARRRDIAAINKDHVVNPESNYCFGEGGAGTYSDGKLYTRSTKRGDVGKILEILVAHGAPEEILYDAHPHIGTNKLPALIQKIRESILSAGGEIHFDSRVTDLLISGNKIDGVILRSGEQVTGDCVVLATGHSARDIFELFHQKKLLIEFKPFAMGVRVEHPQSLIDTIQYHCGGDRGAYLPAASYSIVHQAMAGGKQRGVFSFCMCPGGFMVPAATAPGEVVINGMSPSRRDSRFANSGIVVGIEEKDVQDFARHGALAGMYFQSSVERAVCAAAGGGQLATAQRLVDFVDKKVSSSLPDTSYQPGLFSTNLDEVLPGFISESLREGFRGFGTKMKGYLTNEAQVVAVESRTSSPVRIPRDRTTLEHPQVERLYPCGEGAGYAGGIVSAAMDGERCAEAALTRYFDMLISTEAR